MFWENNTKVNDGKCAGRVALPEGEIKVQQQQTGQLEGNINSRSCASWLGLN